VADGDAGSGAALSTGASMAARGDGDACWLPMIQPTIKPKKTPATA
jgi:hypothetical protein